MNVLLVISLYKYVSYAKFDSVCSVEGINYTYIKDKVVGRHETASFIKL